MPNCCQVKGAARMQLDLWGLDYFDLFLVHFPIALAYVEPEHRYPPEWWGDDGKVHLRTQISLYIQESLRLLMP
jgi:diketogulonate reductase-like aldo/keto reductase